MLTRLSLRLRVLLIFAGLAAAILAALAVALWVAGAGLAGRGVPVQAMLDALVQAALIAGFGALGMVVWIWLLFDRNVARPIELLAGGLRTGQAPEIEEARYLADLGPAARDAAEARARSAEALADAIAEHAADLQREKATLESILADIGAGAVMTDPAGRVMFYNASAAHLLPGIALDRPIERHLPGGALEAGAARLAAGAAATDLTCLSSAGQRLWGRMRRIDGGTLLILNDRPPQRPAPRDLLETLRRHAATLVPMLGALEGPIPPALAQAIRAEGQGLANALRALTEAMSGDAPRGGAGLNELAAGLDPAPDLPPRLMLMADAAGVNGLLRHLDRRLREQGATPRLAAEVEAEAEASEARLLLLWTGAPLPMDRLESWLAEPPDPAQPELTGHEILAAHATGIWTEARDGQARLVLPLPIASHRPDRAGLTYDFALARRGAASSRLADLTCVVFDTETTGLDPATDRIVQIAGLRIARGRLTGERFDTLVNPGRPIPPASTAVHGITDAMVADAPDMVTALTAFRHFTEDAVLVAHNAPFDMGFLRRAAPETGAHFDNQALDTILLSAMLWGQSAPHSLDALTERLGIVIPPEERHTAMGDTRATAEAYLRLIAALEAKGLERFEDIMAEARRHRRLIDDANRPAGDAASGSGPSAG
ncbi:DNA polymerase-3 subunit epsilon [Paracoccus pantotrophus]|uniref:DNA-directed DNA polymerase n=1 Tax=Paracoccus pantotrophus TaxID=82367 RepID=A0AAE6NRR5_PARPN|nr:3'-5' exonuclease [Paracoccus pantotrophus]QFG34915.1 3'-5' exonuclease [Paracoccus pantotrophus]RKS43492.1 DNA polymerase-3 subunit epsilon [Paracoccus pantotrophus]